MRARIFMRPKTATQSGTTGAGLWVLDWYSAEREVNDPMMGWWGSHNTQCQVRLSFPSREEAIAYAEANAIPFDIEQPPAVKPIKPKVYAVNSKYGRSETWTH